MPFPVAAPIARASRRDGSVSRRTFPSWLNSKKLEKSTSENPLSGGPELSTNARSLLGFGMAVYEARFIDHRNKVFGKQSFEAEHDEAAKDYANRNLKTRFGKGHEIWHGERHVHTEIY